MKLMKVHVNSPVRTGALSSFPDSKGKLAEEGRRQEAKTGAKLVEASRSTRVKSAGESCKEAQRQPGREAKTQVSLNTELIDSASLLIGWI